MKCISGANKGVCGRGGVEQTANYHGASGPGRK